MRILLDTHAFLWFVLGDVQLSHDARTLIEDSAYEKLISPAVYWEIAIKISIGKYVLAEPYETFMDRGINRSSRDTPLYTITATHLTGLSSPKRWSNRYQWSARMKPSTTTL
jgi:PIN domain nuclease of toxin-antitoxin system